MEYNRIYINIKNKSQQQKLYHIFKKCNIDSMLIDIIINM